MQTWKGYFLVLLPLFAVAQENDRTFSDRLTNDQYGVAVHFGEFLSPKEPVGWAGYGLEFFYISETTRHSINVQSIDTNLNLVPQTSGISRTSNSLSYQIGRQSKFYGLDTYNMIGGGLTKRFETNVFCDSEYEDWPSHRKEWDECNTFMFTTGRTEWTELSQDEYIVPHLRLVSGVDFTLYLVGIGLKAVLMVEPNHAHYGVEIQISEGKFF